MATSTISSKNIWLDCDPGHDDAVALLLAIHCPGANLLGVSTVHGNADAECTFNNALRCLYAFGAHEHVHVYPGATKPLLRPARHDPEIHGADGLGGVEGLPDPEDPSIRNRRRSCLRAVPGMADAIRETWQDGNGSKTTIVSSGPTTNVALFVSTYPDLLDGVEQFVFMGGGVGIGNRSAVSEFNILCDPEAAQIVLDAPVKKTMIPINVTHTAIVTEEIHRKLLAPDSIDQAGANNLLPKASTPLRHMLSTLISFFASSYKSTFGFQDGPPLHDALTIAYVCYPQMFSCKRYRVDVEMNGTHTSGETVVDIWNYRACDDSWGPNGKNCLVAESVDVNSFFALLLQCVQRCDQVSPLNA